MDNILLLLTSALFRTKRGEELSAHSYIAMAIDMLIALNTRSIKSFIELDLLDPRRRLEKLNPKFARKLHKCLFEKPSVGIKFLANYVLNQDNELSKEQKKVLLFLGA